MALCRQKLSPYLLAGPNRLSSFLARFDAGVVYYGDDWGNLNGVDLATGALVFQFTIEIGRPIRSTPAMKDGVVYFGD